MSSKVELLSYQTQAVYGLSFLSRPVSIILIILCLATIVLLTKQKFDSNYRSDLIKGKLTQIYYIVILLCLPLSMIWFTSSLDYRANLFPISLSVIVLSLLVLSLIHI